MTTLIPADSYSRRNVCAIVVTYNPDDALPARLERIAPQVGAMVVVDNGSPPEEAARLRPLSSSPVTVIANGMNLGIARALNQGMEYAAVQGSAWALLLDQDTLIDADMVDTLLFTSASLDASPPVALIGSGFRDTHARPSDARVLKEKGALWQEVESVITSGTLLSLRAFAAIGPFRDEFFIDYVDIEYCLRARAAGFRVVQTREPLMSHTVGAPSHHHVLGRRKWTTNHSAERRYYIARNNTVLLREYGTGSGGSWRWKSIVRSLRLCKRVVLFERDKAAKIAAVGHGWWDGIRGRLGPRPK